MRIEQMNEAIKREAFTLALANVEAEPAIERVYLFPSNEQVRLIEIDSTTSPTKNGNVVAPFYFGRDLESGLPFPSAIALIRPEEYDTHRPPAEWGDWSDAEIIWEARRDAA